MRTTVKTVITATVFALGLASLGCVSSGTYHKKEAELAALRETSQARDRASVERQRRLEAELGKVKSDMAALGRKFTEVSYDRDVLQDVGANDRALLIQLKKRLDSFGQSIETLTQEKGLFAAGLTDAYARLKTLEVQKAAADRREATYRDLVQKLAGMISAGTLEVVIRDGRMLIVMPNDVLFDSGRTEIKVGGRTALSDVAKALASVTDRRFTVIGHTDNVPIHTARFRSNWDLSTARAVEVTLYLASAGIKPEVLAASGRSEFDPVAGNDSEAGRLRNRRVEIALEPKITELPRLPDPGIATAP
jgi:chemotaxis protein MotB